MVVRSEVEVEIDVRELDMMHKVGKELREVEIIPKVG